MTAIPCLKAYHCDAPAANERFGRVQHGAGFRALAAFYRTREEQREQVPAVNHVDDTGRVQTVERDVNPRYYRLIEEFGRQTGVPILLNTSFNENEPIVMTPEDAVGCFAKTKMDVLVLGNHVVQRPA